MRKLALWIFLFQLLALICNKAEALEMVRQKNAATYIFFPIVDADGDTVTSAAALDSEIDTWGDATAPDGFLDCTNEATEVGTNGWYYLSLTATEMNVDYAAIQVKTTTTGAKTQHILIRTIVGDPLNLATSDDGGTINVTSGAVDTVTTATNVTTVNGLAANVITATAINAGAITSAKFAAGAIDAAAIAAGAITSSEFAQSAADLVWATAARTITGGTITTNSDKTGYSLTQSFPTNFASMSIDASGRVTPIPAESMILASGTAQAGASGSITLAAGASATNDFYKGLVVKIYGGTGAGQARTVTAYDGTTKVATVAWNWTTAPDATSTYALLALAHPSINSSLQVATTASDPWGTAVPGSYGAGTAGYILGTNLNATVSSRLASSAVPANFSAMAITAGGAVTVGTNNDKTGYSLTQAFPANFSNLAITATTGKVTVGTNDDKAGYSISGTKTTLDALNDVSAATVWGYGTRTLTSGGYSGLTAADVDLIWDEVRTGHTTAGTFGLYLDAQISSVSAPSAATVADAVWDELLSGHQTAGSAGKKLDDLPVSGTGDWTAGEKTLIKQALGVNDGDVDAGGDLDSIFMEIRRTRGR